ncbi:MAG: hypothetical protein E5Y31_02325 [Mesorhizobium sp.]|nr:MAG: hypothetical protein E5Y31_02325 [Mesorhizobium sp.]
MNSRFVELSGVIREHSSAIHSGDPKEGVWAKYSFIVLGQDDGSFVRINHAISSPYVDPDIEVGNRVTLYIRPYRSPQLLFAKANIIAVSRSDRGVNFSVLPARSIVSEAFMLTVISPVLLYLGYITLGWLASDYFGRQAAWIASSWICALAVVYIFSRIRLQADIADLKFRLSRTASASQGARYGAKLKNI